MYKCGEFLHNINILLGILTNRAMSPNKGGGGPGGRHSTEVVFALLTKQLAARGSNLDSAEIFSTDIFCLVC